jgi:DNA-binding NarL/FixJ family response regulator
MVVDDHSLFAESLAIALSGEGFDATCVDLEDADFTMQLLASEVIGTAPDLAILDLDLGVLGDGMPLVSALTAHGITVVVVTGSGDTLRYGEALAAGARAVLPKTTHLPTILATIHRIGAGLAVVSSTERAELVGAWRAASAAQHDIRRRFELITRREAEVLGELMNGKQVTEISRSRFVSESTVRTQVKSILAKLQVSSQLTAVGLAHQVGWRPPGELPRAPVRSLPRSMSGRRLPSAG